MNTKGYKFYNTVVGWFIFLVAAVVYLMTIEPTASFWDCGEFITTAFTLQVGHPPGAPLFMIMGRIFTMFAGSTAQVPVMANVMSALASAFTIVFLFWTITHLARRIMASETSELSLPQMIAVLGAGAVGALAYTFSDTFWFSAVEGEVYGTSSMFTALVFWCILKWENEADEKFANRWIVLICYLTGLSIGIHLLNLLAIPAIVLVYYFRKYKTTRNGVIIALAISMLLVALVMFIFIPGIVIIAQWFELIFVNGLGLPYNTGVIVYILLLISGIVWGLKYTIEKKKALANTIILGFAVMVIGYSSYALIVIRSCANPPMDQNNPDNAFSLLSYLNREQYGSKPLIYGQYYDAPLNSENPYSKGSANYIERNGKYEISDYKQSPNYDDRFNTPFPRMFSSNPEHVKEYQNWANIKGTPIQVTNREGEPERLIKPTFGENLTFFLYYQINWMYWRYFMWNFSGRQNDIQGNGDILNGNWITGFNFLDSIRLGDQDHLPSALANNRGKNKYYMLPLILGLLGLFFQFNAGDKGKKDFWVVMSLFVMTGLAILLYLNQEPLQPRERDYAYAGSFYAFAIWIGFGVLSLYQLLNKFSPAKISAIAATTVSLIAVPCLMANQNWDDHDRSNRFTARDFGGDYLESCAPNAILFTNGDNDTFPLWYAQMVEGIRTDVRVCNLSYFQTDWYVDQMRRKAYESDPLPIKFEHNQYVQGTRDVIYILDQIKRPIGLKEALDFVRSDDQGTKLPQADNASFFPSRHLVYPVDKAAVLANNVIDPKKADSIVSQMEINLTGNYVTKDELMILDIIANNNWKRPVYFAITVGRDKYLNLQDYFQTEGFAYRLVPIKTPATNGQVGSVRPDVMYNNIINKFRWGNMNDPKVYLDENNMRMSMNVRNSFVRLADGLLEQGKRDSAIAVLDRCNELVPNEKVEYNYFNLLMAESYYRAATNNFKNMNRDSLSVEVNVFPAATKKANNVVRIMANNCEEELRYYFSLEPRFRATIQEDLQRSFYIMRELSNIAGHYGEKALSDEVAKRLNDLVKIYQPELASPELKK
ncbi:MAG: DUF2723 domain-containing protein [Bacteroidia bacterium]|nr:DUF2723 domain-containing protein [Bacteroidia bacterium]